MFGRAAGLSCDDYSWDEGLLAMQDRAGANQNAVVPLVLTANTRAEAEQEVKAAALSLSCHRLSLPFTAVLLDPTTWTILQQDGPNHLGLWYDAPRISTGPNHLGLCAQLGILGAAGLFPAGLQKGRTAGGSGSTMAMARDGPPGVGFCQRNPWGWLKPLQVTSHGLTAAIPVDSPCCSCELTRPARCSPARWATMSTARAAGSSGTTWSRTPAVRTRRSTQRRSAGLTSGSRGRAERTSG